MNKRALKTAFLFLFGLFAGLLAQAQPTQLIGNRLAYIDQAIQVLSFTNDPEETRLFIITHDGKVLVYEDGAIRDTPFFDIGSSGLDFLDYGIGSEEGLNGMVLDPNYESNGYFYLIYNGWLPDGSGTTLYDEHLVRFKRSDNDPYLADTDFWEEIITFEMPRRGHNGGNIFFGDDGYLYVSVGDGGSTGSGAPGGGSGGDADNNAQSLDRLLGKIHRLDVSGPAPYAIPPDNPFIDVPDARPEIFAYGFRNPWRWSFDKLTGDMYIGDVGEVDWEEVNFAPADEAAGLNYGWRLLEGSNCYEPVEGCDPDGITTLPIYDYFHDGNLCSVVGGFVYRGASIPTLYGYYIYSDACGFADEKFWTLHRDGQGNWINQPVEVIVEGGFVPWQEVRYGFGQDNRGELYICTRLAVYKIFSDPNDDSANQQKEDAELVFMPNPANASTVLDLGGPFLLESLEIFDRSGRKVDELVASGGAERFYNIPTSAYASGMYVVRVKCLGSDAFRYGKLIIADQE